MVSRDPGSAGVSPARTPRGWHSRGYLPHFDGGEITQAITFRLAGSLPRAAIESWRSDLAALSAEHARVERRRRIESWLDRSIGNTWLRRTDVATLVQAALFAFEGDRYQLHGWTIMPNHVHVMVSPHPCWSLSRILQSWKSFTAKRANRILRRKGRFWQCEYFDRYIRNRRHFKAVLEYIEANPVRAGLCRAREEWPFGSAAHRLAGGTPAPARDRYAS